SESDMEVVGEAGDGADAVRQAARLRPGGVVMGIQMPITDGIAAPAQIAAAGHARGLLLTPFHLGEDGGGAPRGGESGFSLKDVDAGRLIEAIRIAHAGEAIIDPVVTRRLLDRFAHRLPTAARDADPDGGASQRLDGVTERERDVLTRVARGLSNAEIAAELVVTETTVQTPL